MIPCLINIHKGLDYCAGGVYCRKPTQGNVISRGLEINSFRQIEGINND